MRTIGIYIYAFASSTLIREHPTHWKLVYIRRTVSSVEVPNYVVSEEDFVRVSHQSFATSGANSFPYGRGNLDSRVRCLDARMLMIPCAHIVVELLISW